MHAADPRYYILVFSKQIRFLFRLSIALFAASFAHAASGHPSAGAAPGPRLLLVEKESHMALFLPESHIGTLAQDDAYFNAVIRPAFNASSEVLAERSIEPLFDRNYETATCSDESVAEAALDDDLNAALAQRGSEKPVYFQAFAPEKILELGRFVRFYRVFSDVQMRSVGTKSLPSNAASRRVEARSAQSGILMAWKPRRIVTVEDMTTMLHAYCALEPEKRALLIAATITQHAKTDNDHSPSVSASTIQNETYAAINFSYLQSLSQMRAAVQLPFLPVKERRTVNGITESESVIERFMIVERGREWVYRLATVMQHERLPFYALGAAHFPDVPAGPGLITLLRAAGYRVSLIADKRALNAALARLPAVPHFRGDAKSIMHTLIGGCRSEGISYGCEWHDDSISYMVLKLQSNQQEEVWTACFQHSGSLETERPCVSGVRNSKIQQSHSR